MACEHESMPMNEMKGTDAMAFDRCMPATFAFAKRKDADGFVARNGGAVLLVCAIDEPRRRYQ